MTTELTDALGKKMALRRRPRRIVSLVPSTTETVYALGSGDQLVAVTRYCIHPKRALRELMNIGGTKTPRIDAIRDLNPDLVLANQEENRAQDVEEIGRFVPVYTAFPKDAAGAIRETLKLGQLLGRDEAARLLAHELERKLRTLRERSRRRPSFRFVYLIWRNPYMAAGPGTFVNALLGESGGINHVVDVEDRYPPVELTRIIDPQVDAILLSSEPYPFAAGHVEEIARLLDPARNASFRARILLVDGELLSWHGARMKRGLAYLDELASRVVALRDQPCFPER